MGQEVIGKFANQMAALGRRINIYVSSVSEERKSIFFLMKESLQRKLVIIHPSSTSHNLHGPFQTAEDGAFEFEGKSFEYHICPCNHTNALMLRETFPYTAPRVIGLRPAIGMGDRIGLATPGHIRAIRGFQIFPILAQQSVREMKRTGRSPTDVLDDVSWAVFQEGFHDGFGADADHLKGYEDIERAFEAGFTMYTIDPSDFVNDDADIYGMEEARDKFRRLPWKDLRSNPKEFLGIYLGRRLELNSIGRADDLELSRERLIRVSLKYSSAIAHSLRLKNHIDKLFAGKQYDLEISLDETRMPITPLEHFFIASELRRLNIRVQGLAIRLIGKFEKGIDYEGDLNEFEKQLRTHILIARNYGPYKLSIHSGSDKFSIYPSIGKIALDLFHIKTSGTSYLEALRVIARHDPNLFRRIVRVSMTHFQEDRKSYSTSADPSLAPDPWEVEDGELEGRYLDNPNSRQILHITFGSILGHGEQGLRNSIIERLMENEEELYGVIQVHMKRHLSSLGVKSARDSC